MRFEAHLIEQDSFIITPALVVSLGRCEGCNTVSAVLISFDWLIWHIGVMIPSKHDH